MATTRIGWVVSLLALLSCGVADEGSGDTGTDGASSGETGCSPGTVVSCACSDGSMGSQTCNADGQSFDACDCTASTSAPATSDPSDPTNATMNASATATSDSGGASSGAGACTPGEVLGCDCPDGPGVSVCNDAGQLSHCECCMGSHPLVEGDLRFCEEQHCYCGDLGADPPIDVCYAELVADACCPIDVECY